MFTDPSRSSQEPTRSMFVPSFLQRSNDMPEAMPERVQALPADWDQRDLDQRVREIGEW